jgi:hypothetical protein
MLGNSAGSNVQPTPLQRNLQVTNFNYNNLINTRDCLLEGFSIVEENYYNVKKQLTAIIKANYPYYDLVTRTILVKGRRLE